jgi:hypothetical protein
MHRVYHKAILVVLGNTGNQGGSFITHFLSLRAPPYALRDVIQDVTSSKAASLSGRGVELGTWNYNEPASLDAVFKGASAIFSVTNYWLLYGTLMSQQQSSTNVQSKMLLVRDKEIQQNKNIVDAAAKIETLKRFIFSSLPDTEKLGGRKDSYVHQFDGNAIAEEYGKATYPEL